MSKTYEGHLDGTDLRFAIVVSRFNELVTAKLVAGATDLLRRSGVADENLSIVWVPGAFEIPLFASRLARTDRFNAILCLGALIRGGTPHFEYISAQVSRGVARVAEETGVPTSFGVLTCDTLEQALERAGTKAGNKGVEAAQAALEAADLCRRLDRELGATS